MATVLYVVAEVVRRLAMLTQPFMPESCSRLLDQLGVPADRRHFAALGRAAASPARPLPKPVGVFPRHVDAVG